MNDKPMTLEEQSAYEYDKAPESIGSYLQKADIQEKTVVDFGCGWGGESLWLKHHGAAKVIGIDVDEESLAQARVFSKGEVEFTSNIASIEDESVDCIFSTNVFEHVMNIPEILDHLHRILKPNGTIVSSFGPLFYSPYGCHFYWAHLYPFSHLIFGRDWLVHRIDNIRGFESNTNSWEDMGLNRITYDEFSREIQKRFDVKELNAIPVAGLPFVTKIPILKQFLTFGCEMHVSKAA
ncbi:MAG: hypothetical protein COA99_19265 [Moraxellaceae bacterium]|nr:MAG: hypothetical protein COA99_19265 [Moraxellaceae bacterium]